MLFKMFAFIREYSSPSKLISLSPESKTASLTIIFPDLGSVLSIWQKKFHSDISLAVIFQEVNLRFFTASLSVACCLRRSTLFTGWGVSTGTLISGTGSFKGFSKSVSSALLSLE